MVTRIDKLEMQGFKSFAKKTVVLFPDNFAVVCGPNGSGKSCDYSTEVLLSNGEIRTIGSMVESRLSNAKTVKKLDDGVFTTENPDGTKIICLNPNTMKIEERAVLAFIKRKGEPKLHRIVTRTGKDVTTTGCHPVMVFRDGEIKSVKVSELKAGDFIATPRLIFEPKRKAKIAANVNGLKAPGFMSESFARMLGYLVGDGYITNNRIELVNAEKNIRDDFKACVKESFGLDAHYEKAAGNTMRIIYWSKHIPEFLRQLFRSDDVFKLTSAYKDIPSEVFMSDNRVVSGFLAALFDCDGSVRKDNPTFEYATKNGRLAKQVQLLLLRFGIFSRIERKMKYAANTVKKTRRPYYFVYVEGVRNLSLLHKYVPFRCARKKQRLLKFSKSTVVPNPNIDVMPQDANILVRQCRELLGIKYKPLRKHYPRFAAYNENRCSPSKEGIKDALSIFYEKIDAVERLAERLTDDKKDMIDALRFLGIKRSDASTAIGMHPDTINNSWAHGKYGPSPQNGEKLKTYIQNHIPRTLAVVMAITAVLERLSSSDIFWDRIERIEKLKGKPWVYDLTVPDFHNFIGNGIFVHNSNILDSVCFVLGRKSAKSLRADKMMEVVFKGTQRLAPADFAKVSIYFDNRDKTFPYEDPQICVARKVNAKGVSIYKINNETVTREKVIEVLRRANVHPDGHNIILQGDITDIIEMSPVERREIIDEISGISEFEEKREKANKELTTVESRLNNSAIVLGERSTLLKRLEAEKDAAEQYAHLTSELDKLRASKAKKDLANAEEAMSTLQKKIDERESEVALSDAELAKIDSELGGLEKRISRVQNKLMDYGKHITLIKDVEAIRSEIFQKKAKADSDEFEIARINDLVKKLQALRDQQLEGNRAVQAIVRLGRTGVYGTIASLSQVPSAYQTAIEICAGQHLFDIVADTADTAVECVRYLKDNRIGRATFLPLDKIREREGTHLKKFLGKPGVVDVAINLIKFNQKYWHAFSHVFGDTLVVESIDIARKLGIGEARYVTLEGDLIERSGAIIGGFYRSERKALAESDDTEKYEAEKKRLAAEIESLHAEIKQLTAKLHSLTGEEQKGTKEVVELQRERNELEAALDEMRKKRLQFYDHKSNAANEMQNLKINRARLEAELENIKMEFQEVKKDVETYDLAPSTLQSKIRDVINKIQELGAINQKAVEEYKTLKVEYDELKNRVDVLTAERNRVLEIIASIEGRRRETFMRTLDAVTKQFTIIFKELMKGEGTLRLEGDILEEAGLIIEAIPAGGKLLNIDSMSGGEKTMTALAFLFAIQEIKPAPFYILDEIDAALDKPNTKKMTQFIVENAKRAQFVVISHNDTTIQAADCVYGVSKEDGESKLVGIKLPE